MVLEKLSDSLKTALQRVFRASLIDPKLIDTLVSEIRKALISADVNTELASKIAESIRKRALSEKSAKTLTAREHTINIVFEELTKFLGADIGKLETKTKPSRILLVGLYGSGKTTTAGKLAKYFKKQGQKPALVQLDVWRPAAHEQLMQIAEKVKVPFYGIKDEKDPLKIIKKFEPDFERFDVVIFDSSGRDALNKELISEIKNVRDSIKPEHVLLVISGDIGQAARKQAEAFHEAAGVNGVIVTKLDGTAKGGGALTACAATSAKVKFIGHGEHIEDLEEFKPKNFVSRLLGMGDLETLLEKAKDAISEEQAEKLGKKIMKGDVSLTDLYEQLEAMKKMGPLSQIMNMIPGMGQASIPKELLGVQEEKMKVWKFVMDSMTPHEKDNPDVISGRRIERIAKGAGRPEQDVRDLLKQYTQMKKVMKVMGNPKQMKKLQKMLGGKLPQMPM
ncbi:MAG TPA: signal recognition particle protein [Nanoarchaeota archaeon]|nr:signal recognition particle protein [Nanoarchaeota archaeon]